MSATPMGISTITPPDHKSVNLFDTLTKAASTSPCKIKSSIPVDYGGAGGFDYTLAVSNMFDNVVINNTSTTTSTTVPHTKTMFFVMQTTVLSGLKP